MISLTACGFQLRGFDSDQEKMPVSIIVTGVQTGHPIIQRINSLSYLSGDYSVEKKDEFQLLILNENWEKKVIRVNRMGQAQEYELRYSVLYEIFNAEKKRIKQPAEITIVRSYLNDVNNALAISREEEALKLVMINEFVERFFRLMSVISKNEIKT